jgi:hypothetical protein
MTALKLYTLGPNGFVSPAVIAAIGEPKHQRQATVCLIARTKAEAVRVAEGVGLRVSPRDPDFRQNVGWPFGDSLLAAVNEPCVVVAPLNMHPGDVVVVLDGRDAPRRIGVVGTGEGHSPVFIPDSR